MPRAGMFGQYNSRCSLIMEPVAQLAINLSWIVKVEPAKSVAVVDEQMTIRDVQCVYRSREPLPERFAHGEINRRVPGKIVRWGLTVVKSRSVIDVPREGRPPRKRCIETHI